MLLTKNAEGALAVLSYLPSGISEEIQRLLAGRREGLSLLREVRVRAEGRSSILCGRERIALYSTVSREETAALVSALCDGAIYAHRDSLASGYVTMRYGVRVGICGVARYEGGSLVGISDMRSLVFRIPGGECEFSEELSAHFASVSRGLLIYSPPGVGKTTALRALAAELGTGQGAKRVCVIDERCEFSEADYRCAEVDILKGYSRREGIEIATRTMSPDVIMIDEIGAEDAAGLRDVVRCGIPIVATAHAKDLEEVRSKPALSPLLECGAFDTFVGISLGEDGYKLRVDRE